MEILEFIVWAYMGNILGKIVLQEAKPFSISKMNHKMNIAFGVGCYFILV